MNYQLFFAKRRLSSPIARSALYEDLASALDDGVDIVSYLTSRSERAKRMRDPLGPIYRIWLRKMDKHSFGYAVMGSIPNNESSVIIAAESGSDLAGNLKFLAGMVRVVAEMKRAVLTALFVPTLVLCVVIGLIYGFSTFFVPVLEQIVPSEKWPPSGQLLKGVADFSLTYGLYIIAGLIALASGVVWSMNNYLGPVRKTLDDYPPWSLFRAYTGAISLVSMAALIQSGMALVETLEKIGKGSGGWLRWQMRTIIRRLDRYSGDPGKAFDTGLLPIAILNRVADRAARSDFGEALKTIGLTVVQDVQKNLERNAKLLNIAMLAIAAISIGGLMIGFLETTYSIQSSMKQM